MSPERPDQDDDFLEDEEHEEYGQRSIFATGWFRAVLVLLVLAVIAVIAVPLIGGWFEPTPPSKVTTKPPDQPAVVPVPSTPSTPPPAVTPPPAQMPATSTPPPSTPPPTAAVPSTPSTPVLPPSSTPPAATTPAPAKPETPPASTKAAEKAPEKAKAPERTAKSTAKAGSSGSYWVQVGAFKEVRNAEGLAKALRSEGFAVQVAKVTREDTLHVVRVGGYPDRTKARAAREELEGKGHSGFVTQGAAK